MTAKINKKNNSAIWKYANNLLSNFAEVYNYTFIKEDNEINNDIKKYYTINNDIVKIASNNSNKNISLIDLISFIYRYLEELGLDNILININNQELTKYLNILDIDYEINENDNEFTIMIDEQVYASCINNNGITLEFNLNDIVNLVNNETLVKENNIDVYVLQESEEEELKGIELIQNLRLSGINAEIDMNDKTKEEQIKIADSLNTKYLVILNNEDLQKGLITVKDNILNEELKIDEFEIIDYFLSNL